jgi:Family of unknown function (DUF5677)
MVTSETVERIVKDRNFKTDLRFELKSARKFQRFARSHCTGPVAKILSMRRAIQLATLAMKSYTTFQSIALLSKHLQFEDSYALLRVMLESQVKGAFLALVADDQTVDDYVNFWKYLGWREYESAVKARPPWSDTQRDEAKRNYESVKDRYKAKGHNWTRLSLDQMAAALDDRLPDGFKVYNISYAAICRKTAGFVHSDIRSVQGYYRSYVDGILRIERESSPMKCAVVMCLANLQMVMLIWMSVAGLYADRVPVPKLKALVSEWSDRSLLTTLLSDTD